MAKGVDSYRFISGITKRMIRSWIGMECARPVPWTPLRKPLAECTVALLSSAGIALKTDRPFDQEGERRNPWWGDPSFRIIPDGATEADVKFYHLHIDPEYGQRDLNCLLPIQRLGELAKAGVVGRVAPRHYSMMGYLLRPERMLSESVPAMIESLREDRVDALILVPA